MYFQLNVTKQNVSLYLQTLAHLVEDLTDIQYQREELKKSDEALYHHYHSKSEMLDFLLSCLEKLQGRSNPVFSYIQKKLNQIILLISTELDKLSSQVIELKMSSLSLESIPSEFAKVQMQCGVLQKRLAKLREIEKAVNAMVDKRQRQGEIDSQPYIYFSYEDYVYFSSKFKAKSDFLAKFFMAFDCLGEKDASFPGPLADSKYYLKTALINAQRALNQTLSQNVPMPMVAPIPLGPQDEALRQQEVLVMHESDALPGDGIEAQPMLIVSPSLKRSAVSFNLLGLAEDNFLVDAFAEVEGDTEVVPPPRSPSAQRFLN